MKAYKKQLATEHTPPKQQQKQEPVVVTPAAKARVNFMQNLVRNARVNQ